MLRRVIRGAMLYETIDDMAADREFAEKAASLGAGWRDMPVFGPKREQLLSIVNG